MLEEVGFEVIEVFLVVEGLCLFGDLDYVFVFVIDYFMFGIDGIQLVRLVCKDWLVLFCFIILGYVDVNGVVLDLLCLMKLFRIVDLDEVLSVLGL